MGSEQHPCCKTVSNAPTPAASIQPISQGHPDFVVLAATPLVGLPSIFETELRLTNLGLPPPAPPGQSSILRI